MPHTKKHLRDIAKFRSQAMQATTPPPKTEAAAENQLTGALKSLFAVARIIRSLKASEEFTQLQGSLSQTKTRSRTRAVITNAVVRDLNTKNSSSHSQPILFLPACSTSSRANSFETAATDREPVAVKF